MKALWSSRRLGVAVTVGVTTAALGAGMASAANKPSRARLRTLGSSQRAARTQPKTGFGATNITSPLIAVSFSGNRATVLGGSASPARDHPTNIPISAVQCQVNFTTRKRQTSSGKSVTVRWFSGVGCTRSVQLTGQAFLAESASKFDASGPFYSGQMRTALSGRSNTIVNSANPSLYIWSATNIYFPEKPNRGVIVVLPSPNQQINSATSCRIAKSATYGFGVHCDLYTQRF